MPEAILIDRESSAPIAVGQTKHTASEIDSAMTEAQDYAGALHHDNQRPLAVGLAGTSEDGFKLRVSKRVGSNWELITYDKNPISWIPTRADLILISTPSGPTEFGHPFRRLRFWQTEPTRLTDYCGNRDQGRVSSGSSCCCDACALAFARSHTEGHALHPE